MDLSSRTPIVCEFGSVNFNILPPEVLKNVFENLCLSERKFCKLVCQKWYEILSSIIFQKLEKVVCRDHFGSHERVIRSLSNLKRPLRHLELQNMTWGYRHNHKSMDRNFFLRLCGHHLHELTLKMCLVHDIVLASIFRYCRNLEYFEFASIRDQSISINLLNSLVKQGIVHEKLNTVKITIRTFENVWFQQFFRIFPNVKKMLVVLIKINVESRDDIEQIEKFLSEKKCPLDITIKRPVLRTYKTSLLSSAVTQKRVKSLTLKEIRLDLHNFNLLKPAFRQYLNICTLKQLEIHLITKNVPVDWVNTVLKNCSHLIHLHLSSGHRGNLTLDCNLLARSNLKYFALQIEKIDLLPNDECSEMQSASLEVLRMIHIRMSEADHNRLIRTFSNLRRLELTTDIDVLMTALRLLTKLMTMKINITTPNSSCYSRMYFGEYENFSCHLNKYSDMELRHVHICGNNAGIKKSLHFLRVGMANLQFLYLELSREEIREFQMFFDFISKCKRLVALRLSLCNMDIVPLLKSVYELKYLQYVHLEGLLKERIQYTADIMNNEMLSVFSNCPSLRYFVTDPYYRTNQCVYYRNPTNGRIYRSRMKGSYDCQTELSQKYAVDWMKFGTNSYVQ